MAAQVLTVHNTVPLSASPRAVVATAAEPSVAKYSEPLAARYTEPLRDGQLDAASLASLNAMGQACQAADT